MVKRRVCEKCGKLVTLDEVNNSCERIQKEMPKNHPHIFDVWFWDYCSDCADKYIQSLKEGESTNEVSH